MLNFSLSQLPERSVAPRNNGITMVMDKGLSAAEAEHMLDASGEYVDVVKLGFGSSLVQPNLDKKLDVYRNASVPFYFGGTLLEAFLIRNELDNYQRYLEKFKAPYVEVSDGSIEIDHKEKCRIIKQLSKNFTVISEVGSKEEGIIIHPSRWIEMIEAELQAGAWKVIAEARESGTVGIYRPSGKAHTVLIHKILSKIPQDKILWEAPQKSQQAWFINTLGANVNLGNIAPNEVIALESLRLGLRSDTFFGVLENSISKA